MKVNHPLINWEGVYKIEGFNEIRDKMNLLLNNNYKNKWSLIIDNQIRDELLESKENFVKPIKMG